MSRDWTVAASDSRTTPAIVSLAVKLGLPRGAPVFDVDPGLIDRSGLGLAEQVLADIIRTQFG